MPELPEVETMVRDNAPLLTGRRFDEVTLTHGDVLHGTTARTLLAGLRGARVVGLTRRAKNAVIVNLPDHLSKSLWTLYTFSDTALSDPGNFCSNKLQSVR